jgi:hypothetical protein
MVFLNEPRCEDLEADSRWELVQRIVRTQGFAKSERLSAFLLYIVKQAIIHHGEGLTEQKIGQVVFGRPAEYDPRDDNIVRAHASRLRKRLEDFYNEGGQNERIRITVPRGSYIPVFEPVASSSEPVDEQPDTAPIECPVTSPPVLKNEKRWAAPMIGTCGVIAAALVAFFLGRSVDRHEKNETVGSNHTLWAQMFNPHHKTLIVPADSSLIVLRVFTGSTVKVSDYASGRYLTDFTCQQPCDHTLLQRLAEHRYTSTADLEFALDLFQLPEAQQNPPVIRYARDVQLDDLKDSNAIMIGSVEADPWVDFFRNQESFVLQDNATQGPLGILNRQPEQGEQAFYGYDRTHLTHGLATISFRPNLSGKGNILLVQGFSLADTQAAAELLMNAQVFDAILKPKLGSKSQCPHFEALLATDNVNGMGVPTKLLAFRLLS